MKKFVLIIFCLVFVLSFSALQAQDVQEETEDIQTETEDIQTDEADETVKSKTEVFDLGQVVVKGKKKANIERATTTTNVSAVDIEAREEKSLNDTLQMIPGIITFQHGKGHKRFRMRGYDMDKVALLFDGIPVTDVYEANIDISKIPVQNSSEIIINRGTCSALYGTTGTVGSINIITKKPTELYAKADAQYGIGGDYNINVAHGMPLTDFYYWITATVDKQAPYDVSKKLDKSERLKWYNKFIRHDLYGDSIDYTNQANALYLNDTGEWPHQEMLKFNTNVKAGYQIFDNLETGLNVSYTISRSDRYTVSPNGTSEFDDENMAWSDPRNSLSGTAFSWDKIWNVLVSPFASYEKGDFYIRGNIYYNHTSEILNGYMDVDETTPTVWGGVHSNWQNIVAGFNVFPSYKINKYNTLNSSILYRWDKHLEREKADGDFVGLTGFLYNNANNAYDNFGDSWFNTKLITGKQITIALEDQIDIHDFNLTAGISYDAQKLQTYKRRRPNGSTSWRTDYTMDVMVNQYRPEEDSTIWGTRDSFNPVVSAMYEPLKDFLILRAAYSQKAKLPTMAMYTNIYEDTDVGLKPEKSHNINTGFEFLFMDRNISARLDYFYSRFTDKIEEIVLDTGEKVYTNIDGAQVQGLELITESKVKNIADLMDINFNLSYCLVQYKNLDDDELDTEIYKGKKFEDVPEHQFIADIRITSKTNTSLNIFGQYTAGAIKYTMKTRPIPDDDATIGVNESDPHSTDVYKEVKLHNPLMFNVKLSQKFMTNYEAYILVKNIFDDYAADPFNPGPGRQFFFGAKAEL